MTDYYTPSGKPIRLGKTAGAGGEATVYRVEGRAARLAKIYTAVPRPGYADKLAWMAAHSPEDDLDAPGHRSLAWPLELVYAGRGPERRLAGYQMPYVRGAVSVLEVFNPRLRRRVLPGFDRRYQHRAARNLASAMAALHAHGYVIGDINESNVLVTPSALVTLIDVDSFQVTETLPNGEARIHPCPVGKLEYTPPELQGRSLAATLRTPEHDAFGLGVLIFQLLMEGSHPFRARWLGKGEPPPLEQRIAAGAFPYVADSGAPLQPPQDAPPLETLTPRLAELFRRCFADARRDPALRPSAAEWSRALAEAERRLIACPREHWYSAHLPACPACGAPNPAAPRPAAPPQPAQSQSPYAAPRAQNPPPGVRNPRPAAAPAGARPTRPSRPNPPPGAAGGGQAHGSAASPGTGPAASRPATPGAPAAPRTPNPSAELQHRLWGFARRQAVSYLRRRYPWIPEAWGGPQPGGVSAGTAAGSAPSASGRTAPPPPAPSTAGPAASTPPQQPAASPGPGGPLPRAPYGPPRSAPAARPVYYTPRRLLNMLGHSVLYGAGRGVLAGALPGLTVAAALGLLGENAGWLALAAVGGAAGAAASAWTPGLRLAALIDRRVGWQRLLSVLGGMLAVALSAVGLWSLLGWPVLCLALPLAVALLFIARLGGRAGRSLHQLGAQLGWERIWRWGSLTAAGILGAWLGRAMAGSALGLQAGVWTAAQAAAFSAWVGSPAAAWALAGALAGGLGGALAGFVVDLPARLAKLAD